MANKERLFRVIVIAVTLRNNSIAHYNDEVAESLFSAPIAELVSGGYIEEVSNDSKESEEVKKSEYDKASSTKTDESDKKDKTDNLGDIANSIPGGNKTSDKK